MGFFNRKSSRPRTTIQGVHSEGDIVIVNSSAGGSITINGVPVTPKDQASVIRGSGKVSERTFNVPHAKVIRVDGMMHVNVHVLPKQIPPTAGGDPYRQDAGGDQSPRVVLRGDVEALPYLEAFVGCDTLQFRWTKPVTTIGVDTLYFDVWTHPFEKICASGVSTVSVDDLRDGISVSVTGTSRVTLKGEGSFSFVEVSGVSHLDAWGYRVQSCNIRASGTSQAQIYAKRVTGFVSGVSSVTIPRDAEADVTVSGVSRLKR